MVTELGSTQRDQAIAATTDAGEPFARQRAFGEFFRRPTTYLFLSLFVVIALACFAGPSFGPSASSTAYGALEPPSSAHLAGTDSLGRDFFARLVQGGQVSILVGLFVALGCLTIAIVVGGLAGFFGGVADMVLSRVSDFFQVVPSIILALVAVAILGTNLPLIIVILSLTHWPVVARIIRAECMRISELGYVESSRAAGFSPMWIFRSEVLPNAFPPVLVATTMTVGRAILAESALSFLGLGDANKPSWGALLFEAQSFMGVAWWLTVLPGAAIFVVVLSANMLGDNLNDSLNPTLSRVK
jgi:peptide/nickel transport system permease protein